MLKPMLKLASKPMGKIKRLLSFLMFMIWSVCCVAQWPTLPIPENSKAESIGDNVILNGVPMRMHRIISKENPVKLEKFYQRYFGSNHTRTDLPNGIILAQGSKTHFITVRISAIEVGLTEILTSISDGQAASNNRSKPLGFVLPAKSNMLMDMESIDSGKNSRQLIFNNAHSVDANADFMIKVMRSKGYALQPEFSTNNFNSRSLAFEGNKREARLVVSKDETGSNVVLTTISSSLE